MIQASLALVCLFISAEAQRGVRGQIFLPNGAPLQRQVRFTLTTENGMRTEIFFTDSNGRIAMPPVSSRYTITVESDGESYDTTAVSFDPVVAGQYITVHLRPLKPKSPQPAGIIDANDVDRSVTPKAKEAYDAAVKSLETNQYEQAIEMLKQAIALQPRYFHAYNDLGVVYMKMNRLDEAADALRHAIKINDRIHLPQLNLGIVLNRQGKYREAAEILTKLQNSEPDRAEIHAPLVEALIGAQMWNEAEEEIKRAMAARGADETDLKIKMGMVLMRQSKFAAATVVLREAVKAEPDSALAHFNLGAALLQTGNLDEAEANLLRAYEIKGAGMPGAQLMLGQLYFQKKDYPKAIQAFETYLRDLPDAPNASQVKEAIQKLKQASEKQ